MTEPTEKPHEFAFCHKCGKRTNIPTDLGFVWKMPDGSKRVAECQKCGDALTEAMNRLRAQAEKLKTDNTDEWN